MQYYIAPIEMCRNKELPEISLYFSGYLNNDIAFELLLIKEILALSNREVVASMIENPFLQFVCQQTSSIRRI